MEIHRKDRKIEIKMDFRKVGYNEKSAKKIIRTLKNIRREADLLKKSIKVEILAQKCEDPHKITNLYEFDLYVAVTAIQIEDKMQRYDYLYDEICYYLDHVCSMHNLCDFKNDQCFAKQNTDVTMGCCHHFPNKKWGIFYQKKMVPCEYLSEKGCTTKAIGCKLFMCDEVRKKGYHFTVYNVLLIRYFFNFIQKIIIKTSVFDTKENIIRRLLKFNF